MQNSTPVKEKVLLCVPLSLHIYMQVSICECIRFLELLRSSLFKKNVISAIMF